MKVPFATLALAAGSLDVASFLRLGGVFSSVMTSNLVFVAVAAVRHDSTLGVHCAIALAGYIVGVAIGSSLVPSSGSESGFGSRRLTILLTGETTVLGGFAAGWIAAGGHPTGCSQLTLLAVVTFAIGGQSAAARNLGDPNSGTTYMTGTLTGLISGLVRERSASGADPVAVAALAALIVGAATTVALLKLEPVAVPLVAVAAVGLIAMLSWRQGNL